MIEFNLQLAETEIRKKQTITEKLDYWKSVIDKHFNDPLTKQFGEYKFTFEQEQARKKQLVKLFGTNYSLFSPLLIPESIYNEHFENALNEPEFTYWFLQHNAQTCFDIEIKLKRLPEKLKTPLSKNFIKAELKKLNDFEQKAESLLHESKFDIYDDYPSLEYAKEIEYLRIKADYYKSHALPLVHATGNNTTVVLYAEHIYLKQFLENELNKALPPQPNKNETEQEQQPTFINNFDNIQPIEVYKHFKANLVDKGYLTEQELNEYLKTAFELRTIPETLFKLKHTPKKQKIYTVFYTYYKDIAGKKHEQQTRYVELLGNYFEGYNPNIIKTNWARDYKAKR